MYVGYVGLESTILVPLQTINTSSVPLNADALPTFQVYDAAGNPVSAVAGTAAWAHTGSVTGATNASPISITSTGHGLQTGMRITVTGVGGNTAANTTTTITKVDANTFTLDGTTGNGAYTSGGTWNVSGWHKMSIAATSGNGFARGTYTVLAAWAISSSARQDTFTFTVV